MEEDGNEEIGDRSVPRRGSGPRLRNVPQPKCEHKKKMLKCSLISTTSVRSYKDKFLGLLKQQRGAFILMFCSSEPAKRRRTSDTRFPVGSQRHTRYASTRKSNSSVSRYVLCCARN
ncbi:hypothetical protein MRX96_010858 [Rhipicephalus microplus]